MRPVIGITTYVTDARFGDWEAESALVPSAYVNAIERAGGRPLLVPPSEEGIDETLDALHGIVFSGGSDLDPETYGQDPHPETTGVAPERDRAALRARRALAPGGGGRPAVVRGSGRGGQGLPRGRPFVASRRTSRRFRTPCGPCFATPSGLTAGPPQRSGRCRTS